MDLSEDTPLSPADHTKMIRQDAATQHSLDFCVALTPPVHMRRLNEVGGCQIQSAAQWLPSYTLFAPREEIFSSTFLVTFMDFSRLEGKFSSALNEESEGTGSRLAIIH